MASNAFLVQIFSESTISTLTIIITTCAEKVITAITRWHKLKPNVLLVNTCPESVLKQNQIAWTVSLVTSALRLVFKPQMLAPVATSALKAQ